jgi:hypothetical protein
MRYQNDEPGNPIVRCSRENCRYKWAYSGDKEEATCPSCGYKTAVLENQEEIILSGELGAVVETQEFTTRVREALSTVIREGSEKSCKEVAEAFPTRRT